MSFNISEAFATLVEGVREGAAILAFDRTVLTCNRRLAEMLKLDCEQVTGHSIIEFLPPDDQRIFEQLLQSLPQEFERANLHLSGGNTLPLPIQVAVKSFTVDDVRVFSLLITDLSRRRRAEEQLAFQAQLLANVSDAVFGLDERFRITYWNAAAEQMYGWTGDEVLGRTADQILRTENSEATLGAHYHQLLERGMLQGQAIHHRRDGSSFWVDGKIVALRSGGGAITGYVCVNRDITVPKRQEQKLRSSEERFAKAFRASPLAIIISTLAEGRIIDASPSCQRLFGYRLDEMVGRTSTELGLYPSPEERQRLVTLLKTSQRLSAESLTLRRRTGEIVDILISTEIIELNGETAMVTLIEDVTERNRTEAHIRALNADLEQRVAARTAELERTNRHVTDILASIQDEFFSLDREWRITYINERAARNVGLAPDELVGQNVWERFPGLVGTPVATYYRQAMMDRVPAQLEAPGVLTDTIYAIRIYPSSDGISVYWIDITERKRAENKLVVSENNLAASQAIAHVGSYAWDPEFKHVVWSDELFRILGLEPHAIKPSYDAYVAFIHPDDREAVVQKIAQVARATNFEPIEYRIVRRDGAVRVVHVQSQVLRDPQGQPAMLHGVVQDITERKQAEESLTRYQMLSEHARDIILFLRHDGAIFEANAAAVAAYGYSRDELLALNIRDLRAPETHPELADQMTRADNESILFETLHRRRDGMSFWVEVSSRSMVIGSKRIFLSIIRDITERKQAEDAVRTSEEKFYRAFHGNAAAMSISRLRDGLILDANDRWLELFGYAREQVIGKSVAQQTWKHPTERAEMVRDLERDGAFYDREIEWRLPNGGEKITIASGQVVTLHGERVLISSTVDITDRKRAEQALREALQSASRSEAELRTILEQLPSGVTIRDAVSGRVVVLNESARLVLGTPVDTLRDTARYEGIHPDGRPYRPEEWPLSRALADGETVRGEEIELYGADRARVTVRVNAAPIRNSDGQVIAGVAVFDDISEKKHAEQERERMLAQIEAERARWQGVVEGIADEVWLCDLRGKLSLINLPDVTAMGLDEFTDKTIAEIYDELDFFYPDGRRRPPEDAPLFQALRGEVVRGEEIMRLRQTGRTRYRQFSAAPTRDAAGTITGAVAIVRDVTEHRLAEQEIGRLNGTLAQRAADLEIANRELESFSYSISHDLRAPVASILNLARTAREDYRDQVPADLDRYLRMIQDNAENMEQLIQAMLRFSRASRQALSKEWINMRALVDSVWQELEPQRQGRQVQVEIGALPDAEADPVLFKQVLVNLLSNALKFTRPRAVAKIEVGSYRENGDVVYVVKDNGVGFDPDQADKLFGVFQRLHGEDEFEGTGVGLAIAERIVRRHGGYLCADAAVDQGATFFVTLTGRENADRQVAPAAN